MSVRRSSPYGFFDLEQVVLDHAVDLALVGEQVAQVGDQLDELQVLLLDLVALEAGELVEAHVEDGVGLDLGEAEALHQLRRAPRRGSWTRGWS